MMMSSSLFYTSESGVPTGCHGTCSLKHLLTSRDSHISYYLCLSSLLAGSIKRHPTTFPCHLCHGRYWWTLALHIAMSNTSWCERITNSIFQVVMLCRLIPTSCARRSASRLTLLLPYPLSFKFIVCTHSLL